MTNAQTYANLWKQVKEAEQKDLPQSAQQLLGQIATKAEQEQNYGQLLKAELQQARSQCTVAPDSLLPAVERLKQREHDAADIPLQAVYQTVLGYIYDCNPWLDEDRHKAIAQQYYDQAMAHPAALAAVKATDYEPFMLKGQDSRYFGDDLLSVIGWQTERFGILRDYYVQAGNRRAALLASGRLLNAEMLSENEYGPLNKSRYIQRLDSLINAYADLPECGELAIDRYNYMADFTDATAEQKWQYINLALERWGSWQRMNVLRNAQRQLSSVVYNAQATETVLIPQQQTVVALREMRGVSELTMRIYQVAVDGDTGLNPSNANDYKRLKPLLTPLPKLTQTRQYVGKRPYEMFEDSLQIGGLPVGVYMAEFESLPATKVSRHLFFVSNVRVLAQPEPGRRLRVVAVNATTGQPLKGASIVVSEGYNYNKSTQQLTADEKGEALATMKADQNRYGLRAFTAADKACPVMDAWGGFFLNKGNPPSQSTAIFTDRSIYRPGQTVHVAAIVYNTANGRDHTATQGQNLNILLRDANNKVVAEKQAVTDAYGTAATEFTLPTQGLTGSFSVQANGQHHYFRVEEYKRPAFEVEIPRVAQNYDDGDTVVARGTARSYAGVPVQQAQVKYKVVRRRAYWWMAYSRYWSSGLVGTGSDDAVVAEGTALTDDRGQFTVDVPMVLPKTPHPMFYNFVLTADVTDQAGETHQGTMTLPLGNRKTAFSATLPDKVLNEEQTKMAFHQQNAAGIDLDARVRYRFDGGRWQEAATNSLVDIPQMKSGRHTLHAVCQNDTLRQDFVVFSLDDARPAADTRSWFFTSHDQRFPNDGSPVTVQAGSSDKNVHMIYSVMAGDQLLERGTMELSNELMNRKFRYDEALYGDGVLLTFAWMKDGKTYTHATTIERPRPDMHLNMKWQTFRNRLVPGQQEEWTLSVSKPDGSPADAQLVAALYDKSLDQLADYDWSLVPRRWIALPHAEWVGGQWGGWGCYGEKTQTMLATTELSFNRFDTDIFPSYEYGRRRMYRHLLMTKSANGAVYESAPVMGMTSTDAVGTFNAADELYVEVEAVEEEADIDGTATDDSAAAGGQAVQMRENLQETAFFYPQLVTDSEGRISLKFTLPESLTTWRFLGVAHTKDMMYGQMTDEAVAKKDVMIQPNMPRFVRQGDHATISARIMNTSDKPVSGTALLQLLDPATEQLIAEQRQAVTVADSATTSVTFPIDAATLAQADRQLLIVRVSVSNRTFSDGEQHYLPILPSAERVTVTVPFTQNGPGTKQIDLSKMIPATALNTPKLTFEYTNNPAWMLIQALPAVGHPHDDCAICQAAALYANGIGRHILQQNPTAKHVFEQWKQESGTQTSLSSQLQKDEELKELLLSETPWVLDADREHEQKERLADFFDQNTMDARLANASAALGKLQNSNGSWSWWPGMPGSTLMTTSVTAMLVRLHLMTASQPTDKTAAMVDRAFGYLGNDIVKLVQEMKSREKKGVKMTFPSHTALEWLYICAIDGRSLPKQVAEANSYLKELLKKDIKSQTIYEKALSAIVLNSKTYVKSLKEYTVYREDMGRYYDTQRATYSWRDYRIPTQVAAIEALKTLTPQDTTTISEMQRWLLQQKRTQAWDTPVNSADAIYAFLNGNSQALTPQAQTVLSVDGKPIDTSEATAGLGYVKSSMTAQGATTFTAEKSSTGTSWGAVYAQFMQPTADIASQQSGISVRRDIFLRSADAEPGVLPATLTVGDRIVVRITIEADRDYDFVQVVDKRAACMEPVRQLSGYVYGAGYYCAPKDYSTGYYFNGLSKGRHTIETEYYIDREGTYETGTCTVQCAYAPEFYGITGSATLHCVKNNE